MALLLYFSYGCLIVFKMTQTIVACMKALQHSKFKENPIITLKEIEVLEHTLQPNIILLDGSEGSQKRD